MNNSNDGNIIWCILGPSIERLNICNDSPIHETCLKEMEYLGTFDFKEIITILFNDDTSSSIIWYLNMNNIRHFGQIRLYKTYIFHKLRFSKKLGGHRECWIFGILPCIDRFWRLCPLRRDSDFDYDIFEYLKVFKSKK